MSTIVRGMDHKVVFVEGNDEAAARLQEDFITKLDKDGWEWAGFATTSRGVRLCDHGPYDSCGGNFVGATETAGTFLYFRRARVDPTSVSVGEAAMLRGGLPRSARRRVAREIAARQVVKSRVN